MVEAGSKDPGLRVHVSCCDADIGFVNKLVSALERLDRFDVSVTPKQQAERTGWKARIGVLLAEADTVLFVLSPEAVKSESFVAEAELTRDLSKRMISLIARPLRIADVPMPLTCVKHRRFDQQQFFESKLELLVTLLDADSDWVRMHTQLYAKACKWESAGCGEQHVLTAPEAKAAKTWTFGRPDQAPKPTDLHVRFIQASEAFAALHPDTAPSASSSLDKKRARRKPTIAGLTPGEAMRRSRPVLAPLTLSRAPVDPERSEPPIVAQAASAPISVEGKADRVDVQIEKVLPTGDGPLPKLADGADAREGIDTEKAPAETPRQLAAAEPETAIDQSQQEPGAGADISASDIVLDQAALDELQALLPPEDGEDASLEESEETDTGEVERTDQFLAEPAEPQDPAQSDATEAPPLNAVETPQNEVALQAGVTADIADTPCALDPIDEMRSGNISGVQRDIVELDGDELFQFEDVKARQGQNRLIAAMCSSLVIVASFALWQGFEAAGGTATAGDQTLAQLEPVSTTQQSNLSARGNLIERAIDKVGCLILPANPQDGSNCADDIER